MTKDSVLECEIKLLEKFKHGEIITAIEQFNSLNKYASFGLVNFGTDLGRGLVSANLTQEGKDYLVALKK